MRDRLTAFVLAAACTVAVLLVPGVSHAQVVEAPQTTVQRLFYALPVLEERESGYDRDLFHLWLTVDGCDTRERVLARQSLADSPSGHCGIDDGEWFSAYDGRRTEDPGTFDIDHVVPLAEAWDSGAFAWTQERRDAFANDLAFGPSLIAVTASSNRSKGEKDPAEWMPARTTYWCTYLRRWVSVKYRWGLAIDPREYAFIISHLWNCPSGINQPPVAND